VPAADPPAALAARLGEFLRARFPDRRDLAVSELERLPGGASREIWAYRASWNDGDRPVDRRFILRRDPTASVVTTDRRQEALVLRAARRAGLPVAEVDCLEEDPGPLDRPFMILERIAGTASRPALFSDRNAAGRPVLADQFVHWLAYLHRLDWRSLGLEALDPPPPGAGAALRQVAHWAAILDRDALEPRPILTAALRWLRRRAPVSDRIVWLHGDYRAGNFMFQGDRLVSILDWELSHLGDPMEDLGWAMMAFWGRDRLVGGMIDRETFLRTYEERSGLPVDRDRMHFYEVLGAVKMAVVALSGIRAFCDGQSPEPLMAYLTCLPPALERDVIDLLGWDA
jgi:aminoglycoside phosphotransferase (APT) family kinase protein